MRLDKALSIHADLSRSQAAKTVRDGRVTVDCRMVNDPAQQVNEGNALTLDGMPLQGGTQRHVMLNKPLGVLTAARDARAQTVMDLLPPQFVKLRCMPVGRLDKDTEGLLLLTTDGELAHRLLSPRRHVMKEYLAIVTGRLDEGDREAFSSGIELKDFTALPAQLTLLRANDVESGALVLLHEGKHRQVRRMFASLGHEVTALKRLRFGPLSLDESLAPGSCRDLTAEEISALKEAVGLG